MKGLFVMLACVAWVAADYSTGVTGKGRGEGAGLPGMWPGLPEVTEAERRSYFENLALDGTVMEDLALELISRLVNTHASMSTIYQPYTKFFGKAKHEMYINRFLHDRGIMSPYIPFPNPL